MIGMPLTSTSCSAPPTRADPVTGVRGAVGPQRQRRAAARSIGIGSSDLVERAEVVQPVLGRHRPALLEPAAQQRAGGLVVEDDVVRSRREKRRRRQAREQVAREDQLERPLRRGIHGATLRVRPTFGRDSRLGRMTCAPSPSLAAALARCGDDCTRDSSTSSRPRMRRSCPTAPASHRSRSTLGWRLGIAGERLDTLCRAALLHDIGKRYVPREVLDKPGPAAHPRAPARRSARRRRRVDAAAGGTARTRRPSYATTTSAGTARAIPIACAVTRSRSNRGSSWSPTRSTR